MKIKLFFVVFLIFLTGCGKTSTVNEDNFNIVTSFYPIYVFTKNITNDIPKVTVTNMSSNHDGCLHDYSLTTTDMKLLSEADCFVINGAGLEEFLEKVYEANSDLNVIDSSENIKLIKNRNSDKYNEHIWLSVTNAISQVKNIGNKLASLDSKNASLYIKNTDEYVKKLENLRLELMESTKADSAKLVVSSEAFNYFANDFGFEVLSIIEKREGTVPSSKEIKDIIDIIKSNSIKSIFVEKEDSTKVADTIANETNSIVYTLDLITSGNGEITDYETKMRENIKVIKESEK